ncbi:hypothetical protein DB346_21720 [Verrucomicrobia bacterium LW23]|nr:hypothetical protein DB346_21720 [Verrucomicrobia bacterium LW23]
MPYHINKGCQIVLSGMELTQNLEHQWGVELAGIEWLIEKIKAEKRDFMRGVQIFPIPVHFPMNAKPHPAMGYLYAKKLPHVYRKDIFLHERIDVYLRDKCERIPVKSSALDFIHFYSRDGIDWNARWLNLVARSARLATVPHLILAGATDTDNAPLDEDCVAVLGDIAEITTTDIVLASVNNSWRIIVHDYQKYFFEEDIWLDETVVIMGKLLQSSLGEKTFELIPVAEDTSCLYAA